MPIREGMTPDELGPGAMMEEPMMEEPMMEEPMMDEMVAPPVSVVRVEQDTAVLSHEGAEFVLPLSLTGPVFEGETVTIQVIKDEAPIMDEFGATAPGPPKRLPDDPDLW